MATHTQVTGQRNTHTLETKDWVTIGAVAAAASIVAVLIVQALALALWPEVARFRPLDSYARSALFTLVPAIGATLVFALLARRVANPVATFVGVAAVVLLVSFVPDYALPDPNKTLLASSVAAFLHLIAGVVTTGVLVAGYQYKARQPAYRLERR